MAAPVTHEPHRNGPQREAGQRLVTPGEIAPKDTEIDAHQQGTKGKQGERNRQPTPQPMLVEMHHLGRSQTGTAQGGIAATDWGGHHAQDGEHGTDASHPCGADIVHHHRGIAHRGKRFVTSGKLDGGSGPNECHHTFSYH